MPYPTDFDIKGFSGQLLHLYNTLMADPEQPECDKPQKFWITDTGTLYSCVVVDSTDYWSVYFYAESPFKVYGSEESMPSNLEKIRDILLKWNDRVQPLDRTVLTFAYCLSSGKIPYSSDDIQHFCAEEIGAELVRNTKRDKDET